MKGKKSIKIEDHSSVYSVEKVLDKKVENGRTFYLIKWLNYSDEHNSWEPKKNLQICPELIEEYEEEHPGDNHSNGNNNGNASNQKKKNHRRYSEFEQIESGEIKGVPKHVIGLVDDKESPQNGFQFLIEYTNGDASIVSRREAHFKCPQLLIQFYEDNLEWTSALSETEKADDQPSSQIVTI